MLGVHEFLIVFDSAAPSSEVYGGFPDKDFPYQKRWLYENLGAPKNSLEEMIIETAHCYELDGYYWEAVLES